MSELRFDRTMSDAEGLMWRLERDPYLSSTFATVTLLDRAPDWDRFRRRVERASIAIPRLRQRVTTAPGNLAPPVWTDDPDFDLDVHVRRIACPRPGKMRQLLDLAAVFVADPFDRNRSPWQFMIVEGLRGGKAAMLQKTHHSITDGERGVQLAMHYFDLDRDAPEPPPVAPPDADDDRVDTSTADMVRDLLAGGLKLPLGLVRQVRELLADPAGIGEASSRAADTLQGIVDQLTDTDAARSPLWTERSLRRRIEVTRAPFAATKDAANRLGGTLNTAFLTAAAHAASAYHRELDAPVDALRASMAVSNRTSDSGSNAFTLARLLVPTGEMPIAERFRAIAEASEAVRESTPQSGLDTLASLAAPLPTSFVGRLARQQAQTVDFATSNVKGSPVPVYVSGAQVVDIFPVGPLGGVAFNLTLMSYDGNLDMALNVDTAAVSEPGLLRKQLDRAFRDLARA